MKRKINKLRDNDIDYKELKKSPQEAPNNKIDSTIKTLIDTPPKHKHKDKTTQ